MEHTPDDIEQKYKRTTLFREDIEELFAIADRHKAAADASFEELTPSGGKWKIKRREDIGQLQTKFSQCGKLMVRVRPKGETWSDNDITFWGGGLGMRLYGPPSDKARQLVHEIHQFLTLVTDEHHSNEKEVREIVFVPAARPAKQPKPATFWERHRDNVEKTAVTEIVKAIVYIVVGVVVGILGWQKIMANGKNPPLPANTASTQP